jgi:hypothetical protein
MDLHVTIYCVAPARHAQNTSLQLLHVLSLAGKKNASTELLPSNGCYAVPCLHSCYLAMDLHVTICCVAPARTAQETYPQSCYLETAVVLSPVYTTVMSQYVASFWHVFTGGSTVSATLTCQGWRYFSFVYASACSYWFTDPDSSYMGSTSSTIGSDYTASHPKRQNFSVTIATS